MANIVDLYASIPGLKADYKPLSGTVKADYKNDWDDVPGGAPGAAPVNTVAPVASGTGTVGQTLSVTNGTWTGNPAPTFTYQWFNTDVGLLTGATNNTYVVQAGDSGFDVYCEVTGTNSQGDDAVNSNAISIA